MSQIFEEINNDHKPLKASPGKIPAFIKSKSAINRSMPREIGF
jgi:hypothetical protein